MKTLASPMPAVAAIAAIAALSVMDAIIKEVAGSHPILQVLFLRYVFGLIGVVVVALAMRSPLPTRHAFRRSMVRAVLIIATAGLFFWTLTLLPLAEAVAITFTSPFLMVIISRLLLGEAITGRALVAILVGFAGVLVMFAGRMQDIGGGNPLGYLTGLGSSVTYALVIVVARRHTGHDPVVAMVLTQTMAVTALAAPLGLANWVTPDLLGWMLFAIVGILGSAGHLALVWAYSNAPATRLAPFEYTSFLWAAALGAVFFAEVPTPATLVGTGLIVAACLATLRRTARPVVPGEGRELQSP